MAKAKLCSVQSCGKPVRARGLCIACWKRWRRWGNPLVRGRLEKGSRLRWLTAHKEYQGDDCLILPFPRNKSRYGVMIYLGEAMSPARVMCILAHGAPPAGKESAHWCGKGHLGCVNPRHLRWATKQENMDDMKRHGTIMRGESHYAAKLRESDVRQIRSLAAQGITQETIARRFGVSRGAILGIILRHNWAWLK